ncbi:hypothetical protein Q8A73_001187 [Channa argus]|nr:hypothetical protein Q8A73_001187 [Channa argus]
MTLTTTREKRQAIHNPVAVEQQYTTLHHSCHSPSPHPLFIPTFLCLSIKQEKRLFPTPSVIISPFPQVLGGRWGPSMGWSSRYRPINSPQALCWGRQERNPYQYLSVMPPAVRHSQAACLAQTALHGPPVETQRGWGFNARMALEYRPPQRIEVCFLISSLLTTPAHQRAVSLEDSGPGGGHSNGTECFVSGSGLPDRPPVRACPGDVVLCMEGIGKAEGEGWTEEEKDRWKWKRRVDWRSSIKPAVNFPTSCGDRDRKGEI